MKRILTIYLKEEHIKFLADEQKRRGASKSLIIRELIDKHLEDLK